MTTRDVAFQMLVQRVLDNNDRRLLTKHVDMALRHHVDAGLVVSHEGPGGTIAIAYKLISLLRPTRPRSAMDQVCL